MKRTLTILTIACSLAACKKEQQDIIQPTKPGVTEIPAYAFYPYSPQQESDGYFSLNHYTTLASQDNNNVGAYFQGSYKHGEGFICIGMTASSAPDKDGNWQAVLQQKECRSFSINKDMFNISGANIIFTNSGISFDEVSRVKAYMPKDINVTSHKYTQGITISPGETLTWNTDTQNPMQDLLEIHYDPDAAENSTYAANGFHQSVIKKYLVDNSLGKYTFTSSDFKDIPSGAYVDITVSRYNQVTHYTQTGRSYQYILGSTIAQSYILKR